MDTSKMDNLEIEQPKKKAEKKAPRYRFVGAKGFKPTEVRVKHRAFGYIYESELTPSKVKQLKAYDKVNGIEWCDCIEGA